jgi:predicted phosphodiesterase
MLFLDLNGGMKIQVISDLHQEFGFMDISFDNADLVILAGDINLGTKGIEWIKSTIKNIPVIRHQCSCSGKQVCSYR